MESQRSSIDTSYSINFLLSFFLLNLTCVQLHYSISSTRSFQQGKYHRLTLIFTDFSFVLFCLNRAHKFTFVLKLNKTFFHFVLFYLKLTINRKMYNIFNVDRNKTCTQQTKVNRQLLYFDCLLKNNLNLLTYKLILSTKISNAIAHTTFEH